MTQEEKLEEAKRLYETANADQKYVLERLFPELKESEDEQHRKWILEYLYDGLRKSDEQFKSQFKCAIAWLEKQKERSPLSKDEEYTLVRIIEYLEDNDCPSEWKDLLYDVYALPYQKEHKPADKFKPGDWVVFNNKHQSIYQVEKIEDGYYILRHTHGGTFRVCVLHDESLRLWTISDARDGDVLACENGWTCIFKTLVDDENFSSYCFMDSTKWFCETGSECHTLKEEFVKAYNGKIYPATKEQREQLEKAMANAGYIFNFEKKELKELKKIEQNPAWSEEDSKMLQMIIDDVTPCGECPDYPTDAEREYYYEGMEKVDWLKSIKDRYTWRPSDEQMAALSDITGGIYYAGQGQELINLYNDLKKLREE